MSAIAHELLSQDRKIVDPLAGLSGAQQVIHEASGPGYVLALATSVCPFLILERKREYLANTIKIKGEACVARKSKA